MVERGDVKNLNVEYPLQDPILQCDTYLILTLLHYLLNTKHEFELATNLLANVILSIAIMRDTARFTHSKVTTLTA